jgi:hypothetical protein
MGRIVRVCILVLAAAAVYAQMQMTVAQLVSFIKSSIQLHHDDVKVAQYVKKIKLSNKLTDGTVEELQGMGAGPKTVSALRELSGATSSLPPAPPPPPKPTPVFIAAPDSIEQKRILAEITQNAPQHRPVGNGELAAGGHDPGAAQLLRSP